MNTPFSRSTAFRRSFALIAFLFCCLGLYAQPTITSFSPISGTTGTLVTISGSNFSPTPANNTVYFGAVHATVNTASASSLVVTVPAGASYQPITVTVNGSTAYSAQAFIQTFPNGILTTSSFSFVSTLDNTDNVETNDIARGDFDGDGLIDLAIVDRVNNKLLVYRNTSTSSGISFAQPRTYATGSQPKSLDVADLDGNGMLDIVVVNTSDASVSVFRNNGISGLVLFDQKVDLATGSQPLDVALSDMDGDGKVDIVTANSSLGTGISILRNTGATGAISFAAHTDLPVSYTCSSVAIADFNGDGKRDIVAAAGAFDRMVVLTNASSPGALSFPSALTYDTGSMPGGLAVGDIDKDGRPDITLANFFAGTISIFHNTSSGGTSFTRSDLTVAGAENTALSDIDGDGKIDLVVQTFSPSGFSVLKNIGTTGTISLATPIAYPSTCSNGVVPADLNNDGRPDMALACFSFRIGIWKNGVSEPQITSFTPTSSLAGGTVTISGVNLIGISSVSFGGVPAVSFTNPNSTTVTAVVGNGASGSVKVTGSFGSGSLDGFVYAVPPTITSFTPTSATNTQSVTIDGTSFTNATAVSFGGVPAASFNVESDTRITAVVGRGASGDVRVTVPSGTASLPGFTYTGPIITSFTPTSGGTGTQVTITGQNLTSVYSVTFGGVSASSITSVNSTTLKAVVASGASGSVNVYNYLGNYSLPGFTYLGPGITSFTPTSGAPGTVVTITGTNLTGTTAVSFGGTPAASFTVVNATTVTATVANGTTGSVSLTTPYGVASLTGFTYTGPPILTSFTPAQGGAGTRLTLTGAHFTGATAVSVGGTPVASFTVVNPTTISAIVGAGSSGAVSVTTPNGSNARPGFTYYTIPSITSFTPRSGTIGTVVTVTGTNFSPTPSANAVYFGAVRATVTAATATSLTVTVPAGASYEPISVSVNGLSGTSVNAFVTIFNNNGITTLSGASFAPPLKIPAIYTMSGLASADFDGDGKADIIATSLEALYFTILRNTSSQGNLTFVRTDLNLGTQTYSVIVRDVDGDTKPDLIFSGLNGTVVSRNTSTVGNISFDAAIQLGWQLGTVEDMDGDGRPDIVCTNSNLYRNTSEPGRVSFELLQNVATFSSHVVARDADGDGKPDLLMATDSFGTRLTVLRNTSVPGTLSFANPISFPVNGHSPSAIQAGDLDNDGKPDVVIGNASTNDAALLRNASTPGNLSFINTPFAFNVGGPLQMRMSDVNGDGKTDFAVSDGAFINLFLNRSVTGSLVFDPKVDYLFGSYYYGACAIGDLDGDGRPELIGNTDLNGSFVTILRNQIGDFGITSFTPTSGVAGTVVTITGVNLSGVTAVNFGGTPAASFTIVDANTIRAVVAGGATGAVTVTSSLGNSSLSGFYYGSPPTITSFTPVNAATGATVTITGSNFTGTTAVRFGGTAATSFTVVNATTITAVVAGGATGSVTVQTPIGTATAAGFTYLVGPPTITAFTPTTAAEGATVTITGTNFVSVLIVRFGNVNATSFVVNSPTSINAVVGPGASGNVSVVTVNGTANLAGFTFNVLTAINGPGIDADELKVLPNPARNVAVINHPAMPKPAELRIVDLLGRTVKTVAVARNTRQTSVDLRELTQGLYRVVWTDGQRQLTRNMVIQR